MVLNLSVVLGLSVSLWLKCLKNEKNVDAQTISLEPRVKVSNPICSLKWWYSGSRPICSAGLNCVIVDKNFEV